MQITRNKGFSLHSDHFSQRDIYHLWLALNTIYGCINISDKKIIFICGDGIQSQALSALEALQRYYAHVSECVMS